MTNSSEEIEAKLERLEEIAETLEEGSVDLPKAKELREEADEHLRDLREQLDAGDGNLIQVDSDSGNDK